jgi:hypothetical protein
MALQWRCGKRARKLRPPRGVLKQPYREREALSGEHEMEMFIELSEEQLKAVAGGAGSAAWPLLAAGLQRPELQRLIRHCDYRRHSVVGQPDRGSTASASGGSRLVGRVTPTRANC